MKGEKIILQLFTVNGTKFTKLLPARKRCCLNLGVQSNYPVRLPRNFVVHGELELLATLAELLLQPEALAGAQELHGDRSLLFSLTLAKY